MISHEDLVSLLTEYGAHVDARGEYRVQDWSMGTRLRMWVFSQGQLCTLVKAEQLGDGSSAGLEIVGGGGVEIRSDPEVFRQVATRSAQYLFGALFASVRQDGGVLIASRLRIPAASLNARDSDSFGFAAAMIDNLSQAACEVSSPLIGGYGGRHLDASSEMDVPNLFNAGMGN